MRPAPQGRAYREQRHYCHITIQVTSEEKPKTEKQLKIEESMANRPVGKKLAAKAAGKAAAKDAKKPKTEKADTKKGKADEVETPIVNAPDELVPTPVEPTAQDMIAAADSVSEGTSETPEQETVRIALEAQAEEAAGDAEVADAKNVETQTTAALNETKPADEAQETINEDLEKQ
jgi:hypothetical protein